MYVSFAMVLLFATVGLADERERTLPQNGPGLLSMGIPRTSREVQLLPVEVPPNSTPDINIVELRAAERRMLASGIFTPVFDYARMLGIDGVPENSNCRLKLWRSDNSKGQHCVKLVMASKEHDCEITGTKILITHNGERRLIATADATHVILDVDNFEMRVTETEVKLDLSAVKISGENVSLRRY